MFLLSVLAVAYITVITRLNHVAVTSSEPDTTMDVILFEMAHTPRQAKRARRRSNNIEMGRQAHIAPPLFSHLNGSNDAILQAHRQKTNITAPTPIFVLSLPKSGTTSIHKYFVCGGYRKQTIHHWIPTAEDEAVDGRKQKLLGECMYDNQFVTKRPLIEGCGDYLVWSDMGAIFDRQNKKLCYFPSLHSLEAIYKDYPSATLILLHRNATAWLESMLGWGSLLSRMSQYCPATPPSRVDASSEKGRTSWTAFYESHTQLVRQFAKEHPSLNYIESSLESPSLGALLEERIGISEICWKNCRPLRGGCDRKGALNE
jgi:hypothetical protein